jgi:pimeloyl-ACP methyl ester carboxylesterase
MGRKLEASLAILNGAIGDYLARTGNGLATTMQFVNGLGGVARQESDSSRVAIFVHGLMCTETIWEMPDGTDYGARLAQDLGYTALYVRYNSGRAIAANGASLANALEVLVAGYPTRLDEIVLVGHSMGGLVVRSACHAARMGGHRWLPLVRRAIYLGTPHLGAPLERVGRVISSVLRSVDDPYTRLIAEIADLRSDGVKDLGDAALRHEDRGQNGARPFAFGLTDARHPVPLLPEIQHFLVAGSISDQPWLGALFGDSLVPVSSATAGHVDAAAKTLPHSHVKLMPGLNHMMIAHSPAVYELIRQWCGDPVALGAGPTPEATG